MNKVYSAYPELAGQTTQWLSMDTHELYISNTKNKKDLLNKLQWNENSFDYTFNSAGFRSDEFSDEPGIMFLGCSHTVGIGIPYETTAAKIVSKLLDLKCYNLGLGGGSNSSAFRFAYYWIEKLKPKIVVLLETHPARSEIFTHHGMWNCLIPKICEARYIGYFHTWAANKPNVDLDREKNILAIEHICAKHNSKLILNNMVTPIELNDLGRDLAHPGIKSNRHKANEILEMIHGN
jgi:hypothetical protein